MGQRTEAEQAVEDEMQRVLCLNVSRTMQKSLAWRDAYLQFAWRAKGRRPQARNRMCGAFCTLDGREQLFSGDKACAHEADDFHLAVMVHGENDLVQLL